MFLNMSWTLYVSKFITVKTSSISNPVAQVKFVLTHPFKFIHTFFYTFKEYGQFYMESCVGKFLGLVNIQVSYYATYSYLFVLLMLSIISNKSNLKIDLYKKVIITISCLAIIGLIEASLYVSWTAVGANAIEGVQGRYFIPVLLLILSLLKNKKVYHTVSNINYYTSLFIFAILTDVILTIIRYFYLY